MKSILQIVGNAKIIDNAKTSAMRSPRSNVCLGTLDVLIKKCVLYSNGKIHTSNRIDTVSVMNEEEHHLYLSSDKTINGNQSLSNYTADSYYTDELSRYSKAVAFMHAVHHPLVYDINRNHPFVVIPEFEFVVSAKYTPALLCKNTQCIERKGFQILATTNDDGRYVCTECGIVDEEEEISTNGDGFPDHRVYEEEKDSDHRKRLNHRNKFSGTESYMESERLNSLMTHVDITAVYQSNDHDLSPERSAFISHASFVVMNAIYTDRAKEDASILIPGSKASIFKNAQAFFDQLYMKPLASLLRGKSEDTKVNIPATKVRQKAALCMIKALRDHEAKRPIYDQRHTLAAFANKTIQYQGALSLSNPRRITIEFILPSITKLHGEYSKMLNELNADEQEDVYLSEVEGELGRIMKLLQFDVDERLMTLTNEQAYQMECMQRIRFYWKQLQTELLTNKPTDAQGRPILSLLKLRHATLFACSVIYSALTTTDASRVQHPVPVKVIEYINQKIIRLRFESMLEDAFESNSDMQQNDMDISSFSDTVNTPSSSSSSSSSSKHPRTETNSTTFARVPWVSVPIKQSDSGNETDGVDSQQSLAELESLLKKYTDNPRSRRFESLWFELLFGYGHARMYNCYRLFPEIKTTFQRASGSTAHSSHPNTRPLVLHRSSTQKTAMNESMDTERKKPKQRLSIGMTSGRKRTRGTEYPIDNTISKELDGLFGPIQTSSSLTLSPAIPIEARVIH
jgi:hypothetical protein